MIQCFKTLVFLTVAINWLIAPIQAQTTARTATSGFSLNTPSKVFVEVDPFEVRVEIMVKGPVLVQLLGFPLEDAKTITVVEQEHFATASSEYFEELFMLTLDGEPVFADSIRSSFLKIGDATSVLKEELTDEPVEKAVFGLSYIYPVEEAPGSIQFAFNEIPRALKEVPAQVRAQEQSEDFLLVRYVPSFNWSGEGLDFSLPEIHPIKVEKTNWLGKPRLDENQAAPVVEQLLKNIYNAFEFREESTIYDQLATSVVGSQLASIYLEQRQRMEAVNRGGARVKILDVSVLSIDELSTSGDFFLVTGQWEVSGSVTHFGHTHERKNQYRAQLKLSSVEKEWKISEIKVLEENRVK